MIKFLRHNAEMSIPPGRLFAILLAFVLVLSTAGAMALSPPVGTPISNQAAAQYGDANGNPMSSNSNNVSINLSGAPRLKITVVASPNPVFPGGILTYTITIENTGNLPATAVTANAVLSANLQFLSASNGGVSSPPNVNWSLGTIPSGGIVTLTLTATPVAGTPSGADIPFSITALSTNGTSDSTSLNTKAGAAPNLVITDTANVTTTIPGGIIEYTINYSNIGNMAANNVVLSNELPSETALVAGSITGGGTITGRTITWTLGILPPGASGTVRFSVTVSPIALSGAIIRNISVISSNETGVIRSNELLIPVMALAQPTAAKSFSPGSILPGGASTLTITLTNTNATAITGAAFVDTYPSGMVNTASASPATTCGGTVTAANNGSSLTLSGGIIPASDSCTVTVNVTSAIAGSYINTTGVISTAHGVTGAAASNTLTVVVSPTATKSFSPDSILTNGASMMSITLTNPNATAITGASFTDTYPSANMKNTAAAPATNTCGGTVTMTSGGSSLGLTGGVIPASGSCAIVVPVTVTIAGTYTNTTGTISTANAGNGTAASANISAGAPSNPSLLFTISVLPDRVFPGAQAVYTYTVTNNGNVTVTGAFIEDQLPAGLTFVSADVASTITAGTVRLTVGNLDPGAVKIVHLTAAIDASGTAGQNITNTASITSVEAQTQTASATVSVGTPKLSILKTATTAIARPGNLLAYAITLKNESDVPVLGITLQDTLPSGVSFANADGGGTEQSGVVIWPIPALDPGRTITVHLNVTIDKTFGLASLSNTARVSANGLNEILSTASMNITSRTPGQIDFLNAAGQPVIGYMHGDIIYMRVTDLDQNIDPAITETVTIVLKNLTTGDTENVTLTETGPNTGIFRGSVPSSLNASTANNGSLTVVSDSRIEATYTDPLDASPFYTASALIDPMGVVFNSITGSNVAGAVVSLRNWNNSTNSCDLTSWPVLPPGQVNPALPTGDDGKFAFPLVSPGDYCFDVAPPAGYTYPSTVSNADLPAGFNIGNGSHGEKFTLNARDPSLIFDIPVDPPIGRLFVTKTVNKTAAAIGDLLIYTLKVENKGDAPVTAITVSDVMPHGISYVKTSSIINGSAASDPLASGNRTFTWSMTDLTTGKSFEIIYRAVVGPDAQMGTGTNTVTASGASLGKTVVSNKASVTIKINEGIFTSKGKIIGRVLFDRDGNGLPKKDTGLPDVALYLEDGTRVITDKNGKFSISGVAAGTHVLRIDENSLPKDIILKPKYNRFVTSLTSQFVDMTPGGLFKANFAFDKKYPEPSNKPEATQESIPPLKESTEQTTAATEQPVQTVKEIKNASEEQTDTITSVPAGSEASQTTQSMDEKAAPQEDPKADESSLAERIKKMTPDLEFLSPHDGDIATRKNIRVTIKFSLDNSLSLTVNGKPVDKTHIGTKIKYEKGRVAIYEFVDVQLNAGEENIIVAELRDQFNSARGQKQIRVNALGEPANIILLADKTKVEADGQSRIALKVSLEDARGNVTRYGNPITVAATAGEILEKDADPANEGHQIKPEDGIANFTVVAPRETGDAKITVQVNDLIKSVDVFFVPQQRPMFIAGIGEFVLGRGRSSGDISYLKDRSFFDEGTYADGRGALFMKGNIFKDVVLTAAYDSKKKEKDELFRESDTQLDTEEKYPIYGDESKTGYEALSREKLYLKLEKDKSYLLYGDYRTDLNQTKLGAYVRSFNGLKTDINTGRFKLRSFASYTDQVQFVDTLPGKGISGFYYLNNSQIIEGSERVVIETRDRLQPDLVMKREVKARGADYEIDYEMRTVLFKEPIPSHDADGNPLYIIASYESKQNGPKYHIYGGRGAVKITDWMEIGATGIIEENAISDYHLFGGDVKFTLPGNTTIQAEHVRTRGLFDISTAFTPVDGEGWSFDLESKPLNTLTMKAYYRNLSDYFNNVSANDAVRGTIKYGLEADYNVLPDLTLKARVLDEQDKINDSSRTIASVGATKKFTKTAISAELSHETSDNITATPAQIPTTPAGLLNGVAFFNAYETPEEATFVKLAIERELFSNLSLSASHKQDVGGNDYSVTQGGLNYKLNKQNRLYVREEYVKYEDNKQTRTLLGVESQIIKNTTVFDEYRLANGASGSYNQQVMGLKNKWQVAEGITANFAGEYLSTLSGDSNVNEPDAYAIAAGLAYLLKDDFKLTGRLEHRNEIDGDKSSYLAEVATAYKLNPDYSMLLRERYFLEKNGDDQNQTSRFLMGLAYRPLDNDRFNALGKIEYKYNKQSAATPSYTTDSFIISMEGIYQVSRNLQLMGKYAGKLEIDDSFASYTDMIAARFILNIFDWLDAGAEYRLLTSYLIDTRLHGGSVEVGFRLMDPLWLSIGYSFDRFDADLAGDSYQGEGPYVKLRFKFDEKTFRK